MTGFGNQVVPAFFRFVLTSADTARPKEVLRTRYALQRRMLCGTGDVAAIPALAACLWPSVALAAGLTTLHSFCVEQDCTDGRAPMAPLAVDAAGDIFGTTHGGGIKDAGVIFVLGRKACRARYLYRVIDNLCTEHRRLLRQRRDGEAGCARRRRECLCRGVSDCLRAFGHGVVFKPSPRKRGQYKQTALYSFCNNGDCSTSGDMPVGRSTIKVPRRRALYDGKLASFSRSDERGRIGKRRCGLSVDIRRLEEVPGVQRAALSRSLTDCADGLFTQYRVAHRNADNSLFGATADGGGNDDGIAFELSPAQGAYTVTALHDFCTTDCSDGSGVREALMPAPGGSLVGTTGLSGTNGHGTLFRLSPKTGGKWKFSVLYALLLPAELHRRLGPVGRSLAVDASGDRFGSI